MVILQFNKLIRNKWLWGAIAVLFCLMFVGEDTMSTFLGRGGRKQESGAAGSIGGEPVSTEEFSAFADDIRGHGRRRDMSKPQNEVNELAWRNLAACRTAAKAGVAVSDNMLSEAIHGMFGMRGGFDFDSYRSFVANEYGLTPEGFEAAFRRSLVAGNALQSAMFRSVAWASPMEVDQLVADRTDSFTVSVARFKQDKAASDAIKLDDAGLRAWYDKNVESLALPELVQIRYVKYDATDTNVLARMTISENDMRDQYDANVDRYTATDTNGVEVVKKFEEVRDEIEKELRKIEAVEYFKTNLNSRAYANAAAGEKSASRLDKIAAEDGATVQTSGWFALDGKFVDGFMVRPATVLPGVSALCDEVAQLDPDEQDLRYGVVNTDTTVWLIERSGTKPAHTPSFEEAKDKIGSRALADAKADAFKASVEAVAAKGVEAILASGNVTNGLKFVASDLKGGEFEDQYAIVQAAQKLNKGEVSEFVSTGTDTGLLVICESREPGDAASVTVARARARDQAAYQYFEAVVEKWPKWNLERLGFTATDVSSVEPEVSEDEVSNSAETPAGAPAEQPEAPAA